MSTYRHYQRRVIARRGDEPERDDEIVDTEEPITQLSVTTVLARIIYVVATIIITLLAIRFVLSLLGASRETVFSEFIYTASQPFVQPFLGLFNYRTEYGGARFEVETLIAAAVYGILAALITTILTIPDTTGDV